MKRNQLQRGYTVTELIIALCGIATLTAASWGVYALVHFIRKAW